ncbi:MAG: nitrile hydratase accessory protein [Proteobacteria bacterium]|nr:nitrile hydratase accessory protein [Pseudomonadota bacterium]
MNTPHPRLPADLPSDGAGGSPSFGEPWQARIFALVARMCEDGRYDWESFKVLLIDEIERHGRTDGSDYYERWLAACERLVTGQGFVSAADLAERKAELAAHPPHPTSAAPGPIAIDPPRRT